MRETTFASQVTAECVEQLKSAEICPVGSNPRVGHITGHNNFPVSYHETGMC
jgi:hypothetical protein